MAEILACPESDQLAKIALGHLPEANAAALIEHIANCSHCATRLHTIVGEDSLVEAVRSGDQTPGRPEQDAVRRLLEKVRGLFAETQGKQADQTRDEPAAVANADTRPSAWVDAPDQSANEDDGLAPPRGPDELGWLGPYRVLRVLGEGGMGKVFLAEDPALQRSVALKVMKPSLARNKNSRLRFLQEARAAAAIEHDNIIHIYQVSEDRGVPFVAMPLLKGTSLDDLLRRVGALQLKQTLRIGSQIAEGLAAAHERKLIHRDIKPGNIWIEPTAGGRVKILDFGLARTTEGETGLTQSGAILGTPAYMPPEQARGEKVDHRADLYSLGCVLYRMATGDLPLKGNDTMGMLMALAMHEPTAPKLVKPELPQALSDLIMKLLAKDPAQRFGSAREVVAALKAVESGGVIPAKSDTAILSHSMLQAPADLPMASPTEASKSENPFGNLKTSPELRQAAVKEQAESATSDRTAPTRAKKKPALRVLAACGVAAAIGFVLLGGGLAFPFLFRTSDGTLVVDISGDLEAKFKKGELVISDAKGNKLYSLKLSDKNKKLPPGEYLIEVTGADGLKLDTRKFEIVKNGERKVLVTLAPPALAQKGDPPPGKEVAVLPPPFATLDHLDPAKIPPEERFAWQPKELVAVLGEHRGRFWADRILSLSFSPDGKTIACSGYNSTTSGNRAVLFDALTLREKAALPGMADSCRLAYSPEGNSLLTVDHYGGAWLWDVSGPEPKKRLKLTAADGASYPAFSKDGKTLMVLGGDLKSALLWDLSGENPKERPGINKLNASGGGFALTPDGKTLAVSEAKTVRLWDLGGEQPKEGALLEGLSIGSVAGLAFAPDGKTLAIGGVGNVGDSLVLWDVAGARPTQRAAIKLPGQAGFNDPVFAPDGKTLACLYGPSNQAVVLFDVTGPEPVERARLNGAGGLLAFSADSKSLAIAGEHSVVRVWDLTGKEPQQRVPLQGPPGPLGGAVLSPDGKTLATFSPQDGAIRLADVTGAAAHERAVLTIRGAEPGIKSVAFTPDSKTLAASSSAIVQLFDLTTQQPEEGWRFTVTGGAEGITFLPDGKTMAVCSPGAPGGAAICLWDLSGEQPTERERSMLKDSGGKWVMTPDGKTLVCSVLGKTTLRLWDLGGAEPRDRGLLEPKAPYKQIGNPGRVASALFPNGKTLAVLAGREGAAGAGLLLWDLSEVKPREGGFLALGFDLTHDEIRAVAVAPNGKTVVAGTWSGQLLWWDVEKALRLGGWTLPDGKWDPVMAKELAKKVTLGSWRLPGGVTGLSFAPDGQHLITANSNGTAYVLRLGPPPDVKKP